MRIRLALLLAASSGLASLGAPAPALADACKPSDRPCATVSVPLDRSGAVPGSVALRVQRYRAAKPVRPPLFLIAGGPGQSATRAFDRRSVDALVGSERRSRDVVVIDLRGTGDSGVLRCPSLERRGIVDAAAAAARCAARLGPRRAFYTALDSADDIDAVRRRIGAPRIALYGVSYGTQVALAYARRHADKVERLALDSPVGPDGVDPLYRSSMGAVPRVLRDLCGRAACRSIARDVAAVAGRLAARLERGPLRGRMVDARGRRRQASVDGFGFFTALVAGDFDPFLRAAVPGAIRNAVRGDAAPLLRLAHRAVATESAVGPPRSLSAGAYAAALCEEAPLPWTGASAISERRGEASALVSGLAAGAFGPFGPRAALGSDVLSLCEHWPASSGRATGTGTGALPAVPTLLLAGGGDVRTPVENARAVAAEVPGAQLLVVRRGGHGVLGSGIDECPTRAFRRFLAGGRAGRCPAADLFVAPLPAAPLALRGVRPAGGDRGRRGRTVNAVRLTVYDGVVETIGRLFAHVLSSDGPGFDGRLLRRGIRVGALRGGRYALDLRRGRLRLSSASLVPGVRVSGAIEGRDAETLPFQRGRLRVRGPAAARGDLVLRRGVLRGRLGGRRVGIRLRAQAALSASTASPVPDLTPLRARRLAQRLARLR